MAQLQRMDARLDALFTELYQVNTCIGCIARRQAEIGGYTMPSTPVAPTDESDVDDADDDNDANSDDKDEGDASSPTDDEMST